MGDRCTKLSMTPHLYFSIYQKIHKICFVLDFLCSKVYFIVHIEKVALRCLKTQIRGIFGYIYVRIYVHIWVHSQWVWLVKDMVCKLLSKEYKL